ncbi:MAG: hypothetical protein MUE70_10820 [Desulfobacterales bacterium]|jgi:hypothetical protein|nr:hypothetical protein [Desulfobacterales bacterium]
MAAENDIVLIHFENQPLAFARIEEILPDKKKDWYHVRLLVLQLPLQTVTWILKDLYINGQEFTMNGKKMRLEKIMAPRIESPPSKDITNKGAANSPIDSPKGTIISLSDRKPGTKTTPK